MYHLFARGLTMIGGTIGVINYLNTPPSQEDQRSDFEKTTDEAVNLFDPDLKYQHPMQQKSQKDQYIDNRDRSLSEENWKYRVLKKNGNLEEMKQLQMEFDKRIIEERIKKKHID